MIPNIYHFIWPQKRYQGFDFHITHRLAILAAIEVNRPERVMFHASQEPSGEQWERVRPLVELREIETPNEIFGQRIRVAAHQSDIMRLRVLNEWGGVYLDNDVICQRPFAPFLHHPCVIGYESPSGICNAVLMAEPGSRFIDLWLESYHAFRNWRWAHNSAVVSLQLSQMFPHWVHVLPEENLFVPHHCQLEALYHQDLEFPDAYAFHLWASAAWRRHISRLTEDRIKREQNTACRALRQFLR